HLRVRALPGVALVRRQAARSALDPHVSPGLSRADAAPFAQPVHRYGNGRGGKASRGAHQAGRATGPAARARHRQGRQARQPSALDGGPDLAARACHVAGCTSQIGVTPMGPIGPMNSMENRGATLREALLATLGLTALAVLFCGPHWLWNPDLAPFDNGDS